MSTRQRHTATPHRTPPAGHLWLGVLLGLAATVGFSFRALAEEWDDDRFASRPEAADPPSMPFLGPPIGGSFAPSPVIFPAQELPVRFFHDMHMEAGIDCGTCHSGIANSEFAADRNLPPMEDCLGCHTLEDGVDAFPPADCTTCHTSYVDEPAEFDDDIEEVNEDNFREVNNAPALIKIPTPQIIFPHKAHVEAEIECATCHGDMAEVQLATRFNLPTMDMCLDCHTGRDDEPSDRCATCHISRPDGRLVTDLPTGQLIPTGRFRADDHRFDYLEKHRKTAASDTQYCYSCHTESYCTDCHDGTVKPIEIHPPNYAQLHAMDAYADSSDCESCHTAQDFCIDCHSDVGLVDNETMQPGTGFNYHPEGWLQLDAVDSEHARAAQRNISACASCHTESYCIQCHAAEPSAIGAPINPHPSNWLDVCGGAMSRNQTACLKCHAAGDMLLRMCD